MGFGIAHSWTILCNMTLKHSTLFSQKWMDERKMLVLKQCTSDQMHQMLLTRVFWYANFFFPIEKAIQMCLYAQNSRWLPKWLSNSIVFAISVTMPHRPMILVVEMGVFGAIRSLLTIKSLFHGCKMPNQDGRQDMATKMTSSIAAGFNHVQYLGK